MLCNPSFSKTRGNKSPCCGNGKTTWAKALQLLASGLFTTNLTPTQLEEKYGKRTVDRLNEMVEKVVFENESYRR